MISLPTYKKIGLVYGLLVILVVIALGVRFWQGNNLKNIQTQKTGNIIQPKKPSYIGKLSMSADKRQVKAGETIDVNIYFEAPGKILDGIDVTVHFNPAVLNALGFAPGTYFNLVPRKDIDNETGTVKITALDASVSSPVSNKVALGTLNFRAISSGTTLVNFDFVTGGTNKTVMTETGSSQNILGEAEGITIRVTQ